MQDKQKIEEARWAERGQPLEFWHREAVTRITTGTILDVGSGDGLLLDLLRQKGIKGEGVDIAGSGVPEGEDERTDGA